MGQVKVERYFKRKLVFKYTSILVQIQIHINVLCYQSGEIEEFGPAHLHNSEKHSFGIRLIKFHS